MTDTAACPRCGARVPPARVAGEFDGACPRCLLGEAARALDVLPAGTRLRDFEIVDLLGRGGMGSVYKARQLSLGRLVALKILLLRHADSPDFAARFEREAKLLAGLNHPNLVHVYDFGREDGRLFLAMEYVEGRPLRFPLADPASLLCIVRDVALALQRVHDAGMVHRDVKPSNILLAADGTPKLGDFGIVVEPAKDDRLTETGVFVGSPHYASPEQIEGRPLDGRSDLYALGVILFEGLAGHPPFTAPSSAAVLARHLHEPPPLRELDGRTSPRVRRIVERLLAKAPGDRYPRAADLASDLDRAIQDAPATSRRGLLAGALAAVAAVVAAGIALRPSKGAAPVPPASPPTPSFAPVDLLALLHLERDIVWGEWTLQNGTLACAGGRRAHRVQIPYQVPEEYDLTAEVERVSGVESFHLGLSDGTRNWSLLLDTGLGGGGASGLHFLDGRNGAENETTRIGRQFPPGVPTTVHVGVRRGHVTATVDGRPLVDWKGDLARLSMLNSAFRMPSSRTIFVGVEQDPFVVRRLALQPVSGPGRSLSRPLPAPVPGAPIDLLPLVDLERDALWGSWRKDGSRLVCAGGARAHRLQIPYELPEEYDLRVTIRRKTDGNSFHIGLSSGGHPFAVILEAGGPGSGLSGLHLLEGRNGWQNNSTTTRSVLRNGSDAVVAVSVRKGGVKVAVDGVPLTDWSGPATAFSADPNFRIPNPRIPWLGVEVDEFEISGILLAPVTGTGRPLP